MHTMDQHLAELVNAGSDHPARCRSTRRRTSRASSGSSTASSRPRTPRGHRRAARTTVTATQERWTLMAGPRLRYKGRDAGGKIVKGARGCGQRVRRRRPECARWVSRRSPSRRLRPAPGLNRDLNLGVRLGRQDQGSRDREPADGDNDRRRSVAAADAEHPRRADREQEARKGLRRACASDVETASSFSDAMQKQPDVFPPLMINLVRAGEIGGFLEGAL